MEKIVGIVIAIIGLIILFLCIAAFGIQGFMIGIMLDLAGIGFLSWVFGSNKN